MSKTKYIKQRKIVYIIIFSIILLFGGNDVFAVDYPNDAQLYLTNQTSVSAISSSFKENLNRVYDQYHEYADKFSAVDFTKNGQSYSNGTFISNITVPLNMANNFSVDQAYAPQKRNVCIFMSNVKDDSPQHNEVTYGRLPLQGFVSNFLGLDYTLVTETDIANGNLNNCDMFLIPAIQHGPSDNVTQWMDQIKENFTSTGLNNLKNFVLNGGSIFAESDGMYILQMANITANNTINLTDDNRLYGSSNKGYIQFQNFTNPASFGYNASNVSSYTIGDPLINLSVPGSNLTSIANFSGNLMYPNGSVNSYAGTAMAYKDYGNGRVYLSVPHLASNYETQRALAFIITYGISERMEFERSIELTDLPNYYDANNVLVIPALEENINLTVSALFGNTWNKTLNNVRMRININQEFQLDPNTDFCTQLNSLIYPNSTCAVVVLSSGTNYIEVNFSTLNPGLFNATYKISTRTGSTGLTNIGNVTINFTDVNGQNREVFQDRTYVNAMTRADLRVDKDSGLPTPLAAGSNYSAYIDIAIQNKGETPAINAIISDIIPNQINVTVRDEQGNWKNVTVNISVTCPSGWTSTNVMVYNYSNTRTGEIYPVINATNCSTIMNVSPHDNIDPIGRVDIVVHTPPRWWSETSDCTNNPPCNDNNCTWVNMSNVTAGDFFPFNLGGELHNDATVGPSNTSKVDYKDVWDRNYTSPLRELVDRLSVHGLPKIGNNMTVTKSIYMILQNGNVSDVMPANGTANVTIEIAIYPNNCVRYDYTNRSCNCSDAGNKTAYCYSESSFENATLIYLEDTIPKGVSYRLNITGVSLPPNQTQNTPFYKIYSWQNLSAPCGNVTKIYINATLEPLGTDGELTVNKGGSYMYYDVMLEREVVKLLPIDSVASEISQFSITKGTHPSLLPPGGQGKHVYHSLEIYDSPEMHQFPDPYYHSYGFRNGTVRTYTGGTLPYSTTTYHSIVNATNNFTIIHLTFSNTGNETWNISSLNISNITMRHFLNSPDFSSNFNITPNFDLPIIIGPGKNIMIYFNVTYNGSVPAQQIYEVNFNFSALNVPENFSISPAKIGVGNSTIYDYYDYGRNIIISDKLRSGVEYASTKYIYGACPAAVNETNYNSARNFNYSEKTGNAHAGTNITWNLSALEPSYNNSVTLPYVVNDSGTFITQPRFCILIDSLWLGGTTGTYPINLGANVTYTDDTWNEEKNASSNVPHTDLHGPLINVTKRITDIYVFIPPDNYCQYIYPYDPNRPNFTEPHPRIPYNMTSMVCMMIHVRNDGDAVASNVTITDVLPPNSTYIYNSLNYQGCTLPSPRDSFRIAPSSINNDTPSENYTALNYSISDIAPGGTAKILVCVNVTPNETNGIAPGDNITINEPVNASFMSDFFPGDKFNTSNYEQLNASSNETILSINKTASHSSINATIPTLINLTINVTNIGYVMAEHVYIIDDIPLYNSTYQYSATINCVKVYLQNSSGIYKSNNTCDDYGSGASGIRGHIPPTGNIDVNYTYYGSYTTGNQGQDGYKYTLKYGVLSNLSVGASFIINVTLNVTINLSAENFQLNYNPLTRADNATLKEGPTVSVNVTVWGPRLNISKEVKKICPPPIDNTCVAACSDSGSGDGTSWENAKCLITNDNTTENNISETSNTSDQYYKYVLDGWSYVNITYATTALTGTLNLYTDWNGTYPNSTNFDCHKQIASGVLTSVSCISTRPLPPGTYYVLRNLTPNASGVKTVTGTISFKATCYSDQCWNKGYMIADQANPNNTIDLQFNVSNNLPWQEATLTAYNVTIYDELQNFVKVWDFNRWNNTPNNTNIQYICTNGTNGTLNIIENNNNLDEGILNFTVDSQGLMKNCSLLFNVSVTYAPPCASNASPNYSEQNYCNPYWNNASIYDQTNHNYILNLNPRVKAHFFDWTEGNNLTEEVRWKKPYFNVTKTANTSQAEPGDYVNFTINITNTGNSTIYELTVDDTLPTGFEYISYSTISNTSRDISNIVTLNSTSPKIIWKIWNLSVNERITINLTVYVRSGAGSATGEVNTNRVNVSNRNESYEDNIYVQKNATTDVTVYEPNLVLTKTTNATKAEPDETVRFCLNISNPSQANALNLVIQDSLPKYWNYNDTTTIYYYRGESTILGISLGPANYSHTWNELNTTITGNAGNGQNITWNLSLYTDQTTTACYLGGIYQGTSSTSSDGDCNSVGSCNSSSCTPRVFNDTQLAPNESLILCFNARVETHENKTQIVNNIGRTNYTDGDNGQYDGQGNRYMAIGNKSLVVNQPYLVLYKLANQSITEPGGNNSNATLFTLNVTNPSNATAYNISVTDLMPVGWNYNNTVNITYRRNITVCTISDGVEVACNSSEVIYNRTWNETDINISQRTDNGYNVTWNLSKLGTSDHYGVNVGIIPVNVTCNDANTGPNSCNCSFLNLSGNQRCRSGTGEYLEIRVIATTWADADGGINGTGAENQNNVTAQGQDGNGTPINANWILNESVNVTNVEPYLILSKSANTSIAGIGEYIEFYLNTTNIGNGTAIKVNVSDVLPYGFIYNDTDYIRIGNSELDVSLFEKCKSITFCHNVINPENYPGCYLNCCNESYNPNKENTYYYNNSCNITIQTTSNKQNVTWYLNATLYPKESILINFSAYVTSNASTGTNTNFAYANGTFLSGEPLPEAENKANITLNITVCKPNLIINKQISDVDSKTKKINITVKNIGCGDAYAVEISDELPIGWIYYYTLRVIKENATGSKYDIPYSIILGNPVIWKPYDSIDPLNLNPDLYANESISVIFYVKITEDAREGNNTDFANVSYKDADGGGYSTNTSNRSDVKTPMEISKTANVSTVKNGDYVNFLIHVKNPIQRYDPYTGQEINFPEGCIYNLTITDKLPETWTFNNTEIINATLTYLVNTTSTFNPITHPDYTESYTPTTNEIQWILHKNHTNSIYNNSFCPGSELWINFTVKVGDNVPVNRIATNYVNITGTDTHGNSWTPAKNSTQLNVVENAFLNITKEIIDKSQSYNIGEIIKFKINVSNPMANVQYNVTVTDYLPCGLNITNDSYKVEHNTSQYNCSISGDACGNNCGMKLTCKFDNISPYNYTLIYVNTTILTCTTQGQHDNYVKADGFRPGEIFENQIFEKHDQVQFTINPLQGSIKLDAQKSIGNYISGAFEPGDRIIFVLKASNFGDSAISNVTFTDELPIGLIYDHYASNPLNIVENVTLTNNAEGGQIVTFELNKTLGSGESLIVYMYTNVTSNMSKGTNVNKLIVEGKQPNGMPIRDEDNKAFTVGKPKLSMIKKALNKTVKPGEEVTYTVQIKNIGTGTAYNLNISDIFPPNWNKTKEEINITPEPKSKILYFDFDTGNSPFFGNSNSPTAPGYISITKETLLYNIETGYGWLTGHTYPVDSYNSSFNYSKIMDTGGDLNPDRDRDYHHQDINNTFIIDLPTKINTFTVRTVFCNPNSSYQHIDVNITTNCGNYSVLSDKNVTPGECFMNTTEVNASGQLNVTLFSDASNWMINAIMVDSGKLIGFFPGQTANITYTLKVPENESCGHLFANDIKVNFDDGMGFNQYLEATDDVLTVCDVNLNVNKFINTFATTFAPGDTIPFVINVSNDGFNNLYNVTINDDIPTGTEIKNITYYNGTNWISTTTFPIIIPELTGNNFTLISLYLNVTNTSYGEKKNHVYVRAQKAGGEYVWAEDDAFFVIGKPEVTIEKENLVPYAHPGETIKYQVKVKNKGNTLARDVIFLDFLPDDFEVVNLTSDCIEIMKFDFGPENQKVKDGWKNVTPSMVYTAARGYGFEAGGAQQGRNTDPSIDDEMMNDSVRRDGGKIMYFFVDVQNGLYNVTFYYDNDTYGGSSLWSTRLNDENMGGHDSSTNWTYENLKVTNSRINFTTDGNTGVRIRGLEIKLLFTPTKNLNYSLGNMEPGKECTFVYDVTIPEGTKDGVYYNNASASWRDGLNNSFKVYAKDDVDVHNLANLDISKTIVNVDHKFETRDLIIFKIEVRNTGINTIHNLTFEDRLPLGVEFLHLSPAYNTNVTVIDGGVRGQTLVFNLHNATNENNNISGNSTRTFYMYAMVHSNASGGKNFNYIKVKGYDINGKEEKDSDLVEFDIGKSHVRISKKALNKTAKPGDIIEYEIELENIGDAIAYGSKIYNITLEEELPENCTIVNATLKYIPTLATLACYDFSANESEITGKSWSPIEPGCYPVYREWYNESRGYGYYWADGYTSIVEKDYNYEDDSLRDYHYSSSDATLKFDLPIFLNETINVTLYFYSVGTNYTFNGVNASEDNITWKNVVGSTTVNAGNLHTETFEFNTSTKQLYLKFMRSGIGVNDWFINKIVIQYIGFANASTNKTITIPVLVPKQKSIFNMSVKVPEYECDGSFPNYAKMSYMDKEKTLGEDYAKDDVLIQSQAFLNVSKEILNKKQDYSIGDVIQFKINVSNPYSNYIYNVSLIDDLACGLNITDESFNVSGNTTPYTCSVQGNVCGNGCGMSFTCALGTLKGENNIIVYLNATVKECMIPGQHDNYVKVEGRRCNMTYEKHDHIEFSIANYGDLNVIKENNASGVLQPGENVTYTVKLGNSGGRNLTVNITDNAPFGFVCNATQYINVIIPANSEIEVKFNCHVTSNASEGANVNEVYVNATSADGKTFKGQATSTVTLGKPKIRIIKESILDKVVPGSNITYRITITNEGRANAANITITDILPDGWSFKDITTNGCNVANESQNGNIIKFVNGSINAASDNYQVATCYFEFNVSVPENETNGIHYNKFNASYKDGANTTYNISTQKDNGINVQNLMLYTEKFVNVSNAQPGDVVKFIIKVKNIGNEEVNVTLYDTLPVGFSYVNNTVKYVDGASIANDNINFSDNLINISLGNIVQGEEKFIEFNALINDSAVEGANKNKILAIAKSENKEINSTSYTYLTIYKPEIAVIKSASKYFVGMGDEVEFTVNILNPSYANLYNLIINDTLPMGFNYINGSSKLNGINISDPSKTHEFANELQRQNLVWNGSAFEVLPSKTIKILTYRASVVHCNISSEMYNEVNVSGTYRDGEQNTTKTANTKTKIVGLLADATLVKYSDKDIASWFDIITYTIVIKTNVTGGSNVLPLNLTDALPPYLKYINNSATVDGENMNPTVTGNITHGQNLTWYLNDTLLSPGAKMIVTYRVMTYPGVNRTFSNRATLNYADPSSGYSLTFTDNSELGTMPKLPNTNEIYNKTLEPYTKNNNVYGVNKGIATSDECINANVIHLKQGWNLISLPTQPINNSLDYVLMPINGKYTDVFTYKDRWVYKSSYMNKWFGDLSTMDVGTGYWIKVEEDCDLPIIGYYIDDWNIKLSKGWNLIGHIGCGNANINNLSFTDANNNNYTNAYTDIFTYEDKWIYKSEYMNKWFGDLNSLVPGKGYWIKVENDYNISITK